MRHWRVSFQVKPNDPSNPINRERWTHLGTSPAWPTKGTDYLDMYEQLFTSEPEAIDAYRIMSCRTGVTNASLWVASWQKVLPVVG